MLTNTSYITTRKVTIELVEDMLGTVAKNEDVYKQWIESRKPDNAPKDDETKTLPVEEDKGWTGFHSDENGLFIYNYMIKGNVKAAGNTLKDLVPNLSKSTKDKVASGIKALRSKLDDIIFINPRRVYFEREEDTIKSPDGYLERPIRVMTMQGPRVTVIRSDKVLAGTRLHFSIGLLKHKEVTWEVVEHLLQHGENMGLGQFRNGGYGQYRVVSIGEVESNG